MRGHCGYSHFIVEIHLVDQLLICWTMGPTSFPAVVSSYSIRTGVSGYTCRSTSPLISSSFSLSERSLPLIGSRLSISVNRLGPSRSLNIINTVHFFARISIALVTGQTCSCIADILPSLDLIVRKPQFYYNRKLHFTKASYYSTLGYIK